MNVNGQEARQLLHEYTQSESLTKHALAVEAAHELFQPTQGRLHESIPA